MRLKEINKKNTPAIPIDTELNRFQHKDLSPEKLVKANKVLKRIGIPRLEKKT